MSTPFIGGLFQGLDASGNPLNGGLLYTYVAGTLTDQATYTTSARSVANANPVVLNSSGFPTSGGVWPDPTLTYRYVLKTSAGTTVYDVDNLSMDASADLLNTSDTAKGDALIGVKLTETDSAARTQHAVNEEKIRTPADYSATFATAAATWNTNKTAGGVLRIPAGTHSLTTGLVFDGQRANIDGDGRQVSIISFQPASAAAAISYNNVSAGGMYQGRISRLGFTGGANTQDKTAIELVNTANIEVSDIGIASGAWLGDSIGLYTEGRQSLRFARSEIACARPVVFGVNSTYTSLNTDHYVLDHLELIGTSATRPVIEFLPAVMHTTTTIRNVAIVGGQDGIRWVASGAAGSSYMLHIEDGRAEQAISSSGVGYAVRLEAEAAAVLQTLQIDNFYFGTDPVGPNKERDGLYLRNTRAVTLTGCQFIQGAGRTAIDMTFVSGSRLVINNCFIDPAATFTLTNARCVKKTATSGGYVSGEWVYDPGTQAGFANGEQSNDVYNTGTSQTITNGSYITIAGQTYVGFVFISTDEDTGAIFFLNGATGASVEVSDPNAFFTNASGGANQYNVYWDAGSTSYRLQNNRTVGDHAVRVFRIGGVV